MPFVNSIIASTRDARNDSGDGAESTLQPALRLRGISKSFGGIRALKGVDFQAFPGEVHVLLGENGAGKSTLIKVLAGMYQPSEGSIEIDGHVVVLHSPATSQALGIAVIHQELALVPHLTVAENLFLGREPCIKGSPFIDRGKMRSAANVYLKAIGFSKGPDIEVALLSTAEQQQIEIAKALSQRARILIMDEPTASISDRECENLYRIIAKLKAEGTAIIFISHRMHEVFSLADRITVLRDGQHISTVLPQDATPAELIQKMVGRPVSSVFSRTKRCVQGPPLVELRNVSTAEGIRGINLVVRPGEIVGIAGLVGAGRSEVARAIFGADALTEGRIVLFGRDFRGGPRDAVRLGIGLIPESRKEQGLAVKLSVVENLTISSLWKKFESQLYSNSQAKALADEIVKRLRVKVARTAASASSLSGGNQQKLVIGKWLPLECRVLIFDEPTRGIDVGAKAEIFQMMDEFVASGVGILMISSELPEVVGICDRVYVMRNKRISGELSAHEITDEAILKLAVSHD
jgi:ribose transport system ATP-binding protein